MNEFHADLEYSLTMRDEEFWGDVYRKAFPNMVSMELCNDLDEQRKGVDRYIYLSSGNELRIDEKKRRKEWGDILLEYISSDTVGSPGWIEKDLSIDFLAYAFMNTRTVYFFSWPMLFRAWKHYGEEWKRNGQDRRDGFKIVKASNDTYTTHSVAVPIQNLLAVMSNATIIKV